MQIGDKVRFLNTTGGGTIKGFKGKDIVLVEDEDGFEVPVLIKETVLIQTVNEIQVRSTVKSTEVVSVQPPKVKEEYIPQETKEGEQLNVFLAYLPVDIKSLSSTSLECYLINDSNYYLSFNYMSRGEDGWKSRNTSILEPNTKLFIDEFDRSELNEMEHICLQFFAYKQNKSFALKNSYSVEVHLDTVKFYKLHSFKENDYFEDEAIIYPVVRRDLAEKELVISPEALQEAMREKERPRIQPIARKEKNVVLEVDLHIDELLDSTAGLSAGDILEYQLNKFNEIMNDNLRNKGKKIVFIHGKGDGVLKKAILKELQMKYKTMYFQDASFKEYGYGATMVTIK